jgi:aminopeptidase N
MRFRVLRNSSYPIIVPLVATIVFIAPNSVFSAPSTEVPGDGLGDPYYPNSGNRGYDAQRYDLTIKYDPATNEITGTAVMRAVAEERLSSLRLDFFGLTLDAVTIDGASVTAGRNDSKLILTPTAPIEMGTTFTVESRYHGVPKMYGNGTDGFFRTKDGGTVVGQPQVAASWFPTNDHPSDKATYGFTLTAPEDRFVIANGLAKGKESSGGWTTWRYEQPSPMASYLATMNIGEFDVRTEEHNGIPMTLAVNKNLPDDKREQMMLQLMKTPEIVDFLVSRFGPYPFTSTGGIVTSPDFQHDALENQSMPIYSERRLSDNLMAHELAHQWFGDSVSVESWRDIWLNEGFATYAEWLYGEHTGKKSVDAVFREYYERPVTSSTWSPPPGDPGKDKMFNDSVYLRGAMTLHALRRTVGDQTFYTILREWVREHKDGNGSTEDLIHMAEQVSGTNLSALFRAWLHDKEKPPIPETVVTPR